MSESEIIQRYQTVINALLPYANEGRLLEGLNKFTSRLSNKIRKVLKQEVERLMSQTYESANNSAFAVFPVRKFKHFGIDMRLDQLGEDILYKETERYFNKYTVGVLETVTSSEYYQNRLKAENQKKIVEHFRVDAQSLNDISFGEDIAVQHDELVECEYGEKFERYEVIEVGTSFLKIQNRRIFSIKKGTSVKVHLEKSSPLALSSTTLHCVAMVSNFNKVSSRHELILEFTDSTVKRVSKEYSKLLNERSIHFPLEKSLESERTTQIIERNILFATSPWIPVFYNKGDDEVCILLTERNIRENKNLAAMHELPTARFFNRILEEMKCKDEAYLFQGKVESKNGFIRIAASLSQLLNNGLLETFLFHARKTNSLKIMQVRAKPVSSSTRNEIADNLNITTNRLSSIETVFFVRDITSQIIEALPDDIQHAKPLPKQFIDNDEKLVFKLYMEDMINRRTEPRYVLKKPASISLGLLQRVSGELLDISISGAKIRISPEMISNIPFKIKIDIKSIGLSGAQYKVVFKCYQTGILRLAVSGKNKQTTRKTLHSLVSRNPDYFAKRDKSASEREDFNALWELASRYLPSLGVICVNPKESRDLIKTVYADNFSRDAGPFRGDGRRLYMHGVFADMDHDKPKSSLLNAITSGSTMRHSVIHCRHRIKKNIYPLTREQFFKVEREQLRALTLKRMADIFVCDVQGFAVDASTIPLIQKRIEWLTANDTLLAKTFIKTLSLYTHAVFCTDISLLHSALMIRDPSDFGESEHKAG